MLTQQGTWKCSEGESWDKKKTKTKPHSKLSEENLLPQCKENLRFLISLVPVKLGWTCLGDILIKASPLPSPLEKPNTEQIQSKVMMGDT